jgi:hypothetical protein
MNSETIYTTLLSQPRSIAGKTWHGLSYQLSRNESGKIEVTEFGWPTKLTLWEQDGPQLDTLDEVAVKQMIEAALPVDADYVIPPPPAPYVPTYSPEAWTSQHFTAMQVSALQRFEMALLQAGKPLGPLMTALKAWMEGMLVASVDPTPRTFSAPPCSYEVASAEAVQSLQS